MNVISKSLPHFCFDLYAYTNVRARTDEKRVYVHTCMHVHMQASVPGLHYMIRTHTVYTVKEHIFSLHYAISTHTVQIGEA